MLGEPNGGVYYQLQYHQSAHFIQSVSVPRVLRAARQRQQRFARMARWLAALGLEL